MKPETISLKDFFRLRTIWCKFSILFLISIYVILIIYRSLSYVHIDDPIPDVTTVSVEIKSKFLEFTTAVEIGLYIKSFPVFDVTRNEFVAEAIIWFEFNSNEIDLNIIEKFSIENGELISKSPPDVRMSDEKTFARYNVVFKFRSNLDFSKFPIEDHRVSIILVNNYVSPAEMYFDDRQEHLSFMLSENLFLSNWKIVSTSVRPGYGVLKVDKNNSQRELMIPRVVYTIDLEQKSSKSLMIILIPIFAAVFFSLFSFLMAFDNFVGRYYISIGGVTAILGYRFVIENLSPKVGYFTLSDKLYIFFLALSMSIFFFQLMLAHIADKKETKIFWPFYIKVQDFIFLVMAIIFFVGVSVLIIL